MSRFLFALSLILCLTLGGCQNAYSGPVNSDITLNWTAPGDDGMIGQAHSYELKMSDDSATLAAWDGATTVATFPTTGPAGTSETYETSLVLETGGVYYFAIKTRDDDGNWSGVSNIVSVIIPDNVPPEVINDLTITVNITVPD